MKTHTLSFRYLFTLGERVAEHVAAIVAGFILMVIGLALGVTMVLLPLGLVVGLTGVLLFIWGVLSRDDMS